LGAPVHVEVDRPMGTVHPEHTDILYTLNYGFVQATVSGDGMPVDAYLVGIDTPVQQADGVVIALVVRNDDVEDKLVVATGERAPDAYDRQEIMRAVDFQEQYFQSRIVMRNER